MAPQNTGIVVPDDPATHIPAALLPLPRHYADTVSHVLIPHGLVQDRYGNHQSAGDRPSR